MKPVGWARIRKSFALVGIFLAATLFGTAWAGGGWATYRANDYGFSMLVPGGTVLIEREGFHGWGRLTGSYEGVHLYALTKQGEQATEADIEAVGLALTGIPSSRWKTIKSGYNQNGWNWFTTVEATQGGKLFVGDYGTGPSGSYLLLLETTDADYYAHKSDYKAWYNSIMLF